MSKPLKLENGKIKEIPATEDLPGQEEVTDLREIVKQIVFELIETGFEFKDERILNLLNE